MVASPPYSEQLDAWLLAEGRDLVIAEDRAGTRRMLTDAERERALRLDLERRLLELQQKT